MFHGFAQCSDVFFEVALQYALNGFIVHLIDFEGFGFAGGKRVTSLRVFNMHKQVTTLLSQVRPDLPLFLFGHSMGCLVLNSFLCLNPDIAERLAGVMYSAPFYGLPDYKHIDPVKMEVLKLLSLAIDEFVINAELPLHKVTRNRNQHISVLHSSSIFIPMIFLS